MEGYDFVVFAYKIKIQLTSMDGIVEMIWRVPTDCHSITEERLLDEYDCMPVAFSYQISRSIKTQVDNLYERQYVE